MHENMFLIFLYLEENNDSIWAAVSIGLKINYTLSIIRRRQDRMRFSYENGFRTFGLKKRFFLND